jgi:intein-encoded DNA endonuclease-like protein
MAAILLLHEAGKTAYRINRLLGLPKHTAERALKKASIDISSRRWQRADPLKNHKEDIISRYESGDGVHLIAKDYLCQDAAIIRFLRRNGIQLRSLRDYAYGVDESFFDTIDNEVKAYVLGFWMADGCNMSHIPVISMSITDKEILERIAHELKFFGPIHLIQPRGKAKLVQYAIHIGSRRMSDALTRLGCVRGKTYLATFPTLDDVPRNLQRHLIRGWSDGDGTITCSTRGEKRRWHARIVGTEASCRGIAACVKEHLGFDGLVFPVHRGEKHTTWAFTVSDKQHLVKYLKWLYNRSTIYLDRKREKSILASA